MTVVRAAINFLIDGLNVLVDGLNVLIRGANLIKPGSDIPSIPDMPHLARGGIVLGPTLALIGEAGPEAVVPLGGGAGGPLELVGRLTIDDDGMRDDPGRRARRASARRGVGALDGGAAVTITTVLARADTYAEEANPARTHGPDTPLLVGGAAGAAAHGVPVVADRAAGRRQRDRGDAVPAHGRARRAARSTCACAR